VRQAAFDAAKGQVAFAKLLVEGISIREPEIFWRHPHRWWPHRPQGGRAVRLVASARAMAIRYHVMERSTLARLAGVKALVHVSERDLDALGEAQAVFLDLIVAQQVEDIAHGTPPSNAVSVKRLSARDRERLQVGFERSQPSMI